MYEKAVSFLYEIPRWLQYGPHWSLEDDESERLGKSLSDALATLPESKFQAFEKILDKYLPWGTLAFTSITLTYPRIQQTRYLLAQQARQAEIARRRAAGEPVLEVVRGNRADKAAPIIDSQEATVPVTTGFVEETQPVGPFGRPGKDAHPQAEDDGGGDSSGSGHVAFPAG